MAAGLDAEIIVNVQGDEPLIEPAVIEQAESTIVVGPAARAHVDARGTLIMTLA